MIKPNLSNCYFEGQHISLPMGGGGGTNNVKYARYM